MRLVRYTLSEEIPAGGSSELNVETDMRRDITVIVSIEYYGTFAGLRIVWLYSMDGNVYDSVSEAIKLGRYYELTPPSSEDGDTVSITFNIPPLSYFVKILAINLDESNSVFCNIAAMCSVGDRPNVVGWPLEWW